jgi:hypothetical protein
MDAAIGANMAGTAGAGGRGQSETGQQGQGDDTMHEYSFD